MLGNVSCFCRLLTYFFKINLFKKLFQEHNECPMVGPSLGLTLVTLVTLTDQELFAKVISRQQKTPLARKEFIGVGCE